MDNPSQEDFASKIDSKRLILSSKHFFENGREVLVESYDRTELISKTVSNFNEQGLEIETLEYVGTDELPFKIVSREFNERGQLLTTSVNYGDGEPLVDVNIYDPQGRLIQSTHHEDDDAEYTDLYTYEGDCPEPSTHVTSSLDQEAHETRFEYVKLNGEYRLVEKYYKNSFDKYLSRVTKFYLHGERPNGVVVEIFNSLGELLEECREITDIKGHVLKSSWHINSDEDCEPYKYSLYEYDSAGRITFAEHFEHGIRIGFELTSYDSQGRMLRDYRGLDPYDTLLICKYES